MMILRRIRLQVANVLVTPLQRIGLMLAVKASPKRITNGIVVCDFSFGASVDQEALDKIRLSLALIERESQATFSRVRRYIPRIVIVGSGSPRYVPALKAAVLRRGYLRKALPEQIALTLVHEAVHGRLWTWGINYPQALRERIEGICVEAEVTFAQCLPGAAQLASEARRKLEGRWWEDDCTVPS